MSTLGHPTGIMMGYPTGKIRRDPTGIKVGPTGKIGWDPTGKSRQDPIGIWWDPDEFSQWVPLCVPLGFQWDPIGIPSQIFTGDYLDVVLGFILHLVINKYFKTFNCFNSN